MGSKACKINEVNGTWPRHEVDGEGENEDSKRRENRGKVVTRLFPQLLPQVLFTEATNLSTEHHQKNRYGEQVNAMVYEVMVTQLHVLEVHRLKKIWEAPPHPHRERQWTRVGSRWFNPTVHNLCWEHVSFTTSHCGNWTGYTIIVLCLYCIVSCVYVYIYGTKWNW